jgi:hypothetical protein
MGVTSINLRLGEGDVVIDGGDVTSFGQGVLPNFSGLQNGTLTLLQSAGGFLTFGATSNPLFVLLNHINAQAATATGSGISVAIDTSLFTAPVTANFNLNTVGNAGTHQSDSDDYVHGAREVFAIGYGDQTGSVGATTWNLNATGKNFVELFTHGSDTTTTVNMTGAGSLTLFGVSDEFDKVATINDKATGAQVITGALQTDGSSKSYTGFLTDNTALTSLNVASTNAGNFIDLSGFEQNQMTALLAGTLHVGGGTVVFDAEVLTGLSPALNLSGIGGIFNVGWGGQEGSGPADAGTIDFHFLPGSANTLTFYHGVDAETFLCGWTDACGESGSTYTTDSTLSVINTPNTFTMNLQDENFHHNNFIITALDTTLTTNTLTLKLGTPGTFPLPNGVLGNTNEEPDGVDGSWTTNGYGNINIVLAGDGDVYLASNPCNGGFIANQNAGGSATINISGALIDNGGHTETLEFGNLQSVTLDAYKLFASPASIAALGVTTFDGTINDTAQAFLELGATDATIINATKGAGLEMQDPGTSIDDVFTVHGTSNVFNTLQGTLGLVKDFTNGNDGIFGTGNLLSDNIFGGSQGDNIWDTAGVTNITLIAPNNDTIFYSQFELNSHCDFALVITDSRGNFDGNGFTGTRLTTISGFTPGADTSGNPPGTIGNQDTIDFNTDSWGFGNTNNVGGTYQGLVDGDLDRVWSLDSHYANVFILGSSGTTLNPNSDMIAVQIAGGFKDAQAAAASFTGTNAVTFASGEHIDSGDSIDMLIAFNLAGGGTEIADMHITNSTGSDISSTFGLTTTGSDAQITGHGLVKLVGVALTSIEGTVAGSNDAVHFTAA